MNVISHVTTLTVDIQTDAGHSGTSQLRSPTGLRKGDLNGEVTILPGQTLYSLYLGT